MFLLPIAAIVINLAGTVAGHGFVKRIDVGGSEYGGYLVDHYPWQSSVPELIAWSTKATDQGFVVTGNQDPDIICHRDAKPAALSANIAAGGSVTLYWNTWPSDHHGPVITYLAKCKGDCASVDKNTLEFFKIDAGGYNVHTNSWASDQLITNGYSRTVRIPSDIEDGVYVLRHEIIALHGAASGAAQSYPQCINLRITGGGTVSPSGTLGNQLYKSTESGLHPNIWNSLSSYAIPGPSIYRGGGGITSSTSQGSVTTSIMDPPTSACS